MSSEFAVREATGADAEAIARKAMGIAADICIFTNQSITLESIDAA